MQSKIATQDIVYDAFLNIGYDSTTSKYLTLHLDQSSLSTSSLGHIDTYVYIPANNTYKLINECSVDKACAIYADSSSTYCVINYDVTDYISSSSNGALTLKYVYNIGDGTTVSPICIYKGTSNVYFVMTAEVGTTPSPTLAPTSLGKSVSRLNSQAPYYITGLAFFLFAGLGVVIVRLREKNATLVQLDLFKTCIELATLGASLVSELYLIGVMFITPGYYQFGVSLLTFRLIHVVPAAYILITLFAPLNACKQSVYHKLLSKEGLYDHLNEYTVVIVIVWVESILLKLLPWSHSSFASLSFGFPDIHLMRNVLYVKLLQSFVSIVIQSIVISKYGFGFALSYITLSLSVVTFVQGLIKSIVKINVMKDMRVSLLKPGRRGSVVDAIKLSQMIESGNADSKDSEKFDGVSVIDISHIRTRMSILYAYLVQSMSGKGTHTKQSPDSDVTGDCKIPGEGEHDNAAASADDESRASRISSSLKRLVNSVRLNLSALFTAEPAVEEAAFTHSLSDRDKDTTTFTVENPVIASAASGDNNEEAESEVLAEGWVELFHKKYQRNYWKNSITGEKTWKKPLKSIDPNDLRATFTKINSDRAAEAGVTITVKTEGDAKSAFLNRVVKMSK